MLFDSLRLNPYPTRQESDSWLFTTARGSRYELYFVEGEGYFDGHSFAPFVRMFGFRPLSPPNSIPADARIRDTVLTRIGQFFAIREHILVYVCDQSDQRQLARKRLFDRWAIGASTENLLKMDFQFDGSLFLSIVTRPDNPFLGDLMAALPQTGQAYK
jgi:hypothetical protein